VPSLDGIDEPPCLSGRVLIIGFGRFGQVVSQPLLLRGVDVSIIDSDVEMIRAAGRFGFKVYYGDGTRLDVLRASGASKADAILVCSDRPEAADRIVEVARHEFPLAKLFVRSFDRGHTLRLIAAGVNYEVRETFESAMVFGEQVLAGLGFEASAVAETMADVRARDRERLALQVVGGITAGRSLMRGNLATPEPEPLVRPQHESRALNQDAAAVIERPESPSR
jgi:glutathione-regulated potassium-efflux system protein KefB